MLIPVWLPSKTTRLSNPWPAVPDWSHVWLPSKTTRLSNWPGRWGWQMPVWLPSKTTRLSNLKVEKSTTTHAVLFQMDLPSLPVYSIKSGASSQSSQKSWSSRITSSAGRNWSNFGINFPVSAKISVIINFDFRYFCRYQDDLKLFYYRGLKEWGREKGYLMDTCLTAQDRYKAYLDYFRIAYDG